MTQSPILSPPPRDGFDAVVHALRWTAHHGDLDVAQACAVVMRESYQHLRKQAWDQLTPDEQNALKTLMKPETQSA